MGFDLHLFARHILFMIKSASLAFLANTELAWIVPMAIPFLSMTGLAMRIVFQVRADLYVVVDWY